MLYFWKVGGSMISNITFFLTTHMPMQCCPPGAFLDLCIWEIWFPQNGEPWWNLGPTHINWASFTIKYEKVYFTLCKHVSVYLGWDFDICLPYIPSQPTTTPHLLRINRQRTTEMYFELVFSCPGESLWTRSHLKPYTSSQDHARPLIWSIAVKRTMSIILRWRIQRQIQIQRQRQSA